MLVECITSNFITSQEPQENLRTREEDSRDGGMSYLWNKRNASSTSILCPISHSETFLFSFVDYNFKNALHDRFKDNSLFIWKPAQQQEFDAIKNAISLETTLAFYYPIKDDFPSWCLNNWSWSDFVTGQEINRFRQENIIVKKLRYANVERELLSDAYKSLICRSFSYTRCKLGSLKLIFAGNTSRNSWKSRPCCS